MELIIFIMMNLFLRIDPTNATDAIAGPVVFTDCPNQISLEIRSNQATIDAHWDEPVVENAVEMQNNYESGHEFPIGTRTVNYTAIGVNETAECLFNVVVKDKEPPLFVNCDKTINIEIPNGQQSAAVSWMLPAAIDNADVSVNMTPTALRSPGDVFKYGPTKLKYYATDSFCNEGSCDLIINLYWANFTEDEPRIHDCPDDVEFLITNSSSTAIITWTPPTTDMEFSIFHPQPDISSTIEPGYSFPLGVTIVEYVASVSSGGIMRYNLCTFTVRILDRYPTQVIEKIDPDPEPTIQGLPTATVTWQAPVFEDQRPFTVSASNSALSGVFDIGTSKIKYSTDDGDCNTDDASSTVVITVYDWEDPIISECPSNQTKETNMGRNNKRVYYSEPSIFDNSGHYSVSWSRNSGQKFFIGLTQVTLTASDPSGNQDECYFYVKVYDYEPPIMVCDDVTVPTSLGLETGVATYDINSLGITDNSQQPVDHVTSIASGSVFDLGSTSVDVNATDLYGNSNDCTFDVIVEDREAPVFAGCPSDLEALADDGLPTHNIGWTEPTAIDNTDPNPSIENDVESGILFYIGSTLVTYTATDTYSNVGFCTFSVVIIDDQPPIITNCPGDQTISTDPGMPTGATTWSDATLFDNSLGQIDVSWSTAKNSAFVIGSTTVTLTATDESDNEASCDFTIHVYDNEPPVLTCPDVTAPNDFRLPSAVVTWADPGATDNSGLDVTLTSSIPSGSNFVLGSTLIEYNGTDPFGNMETCTFTVTVEDTESPYFTFCPDDISNSADPGVWNNAVEWTDPVASDNSGNEPHVVSNYNSGDVFNIGNTTVEYKATDDVNNPNTTCSFNIEVIDYEAPIIINCPGNQTIPTDHRMPTGATTWTDATLNDNSLGEIDFWWSIPKNTDFPIGLTTVTLTARDESENEETCNFYINVYDEESPVLTCPDVTVQNAFRLPSAVVTWADPGATDNSGLDVTLAFSIPSGSNFNLGQTVVEYNGTDPFGNVGNCSFVVTVEGESFKLLN
ncbi:hyalin-like [Antedon mediterranea]|uniref:hyalin-like n=1 Tax=Antedon mediterranea TaxID=105859 RepID=UPI003AF87424